jgi:hypothetical protein
MVVLFLIGIRSGYRSYAAQARPAREVADVHRLVTLPASPKAKPTAGVCAGAAADRGRGAWACDIAMHPALPRAA